MEAAEAIRKIANVGDMKLRVCSVDAVNGSKCDVTPLDGGAPMKDVRLNANIESDLGIVITPVIGEDKHVLVCELTPHDAYVAMFSEIEKITVKGKDKVEVEIKEGEVSFNGGENGGMVKVSQMVSWMKKVYQDMNSLKLQLSTAIVAGNNAPLGIVFNPQTDFPNKGDFENTKVKH